MCNSPAQQNVNEVASPSGACHHARPKFFSHKPMSSRAFLCARLICCSFAASGGVLAAELSEQDYFSELPVVLRVSRLAQPLSETPGAVTIIDQEIIRRSGARELADVLRLVPGYMVSGYNGANPTASYHAPLDEYGLRNLVLIDGRSVYSSYYLGDTHRGMMGVLLEDIERIEVLRGSNSAAYGANAMFGVINIITRHTADTHGTAVSVTSGQAGVNDNMARIGWGGEMASFRLSTGRRGDSGYGNVYDDKIVSQLHFRGDLRPAADQELMISAGVAQLAGGEGFPSNEGNPERTMKWRDVYLQGQWRQMLSGSDEIKLTASFDEETLWDAFAHVADPSVIVSSRGRGRRLNLELQHQMGISSELRAVWGVGYKYEEAVSPPLYATREAVSVHEERLFGNLEWRPHPQWLINAGGFAGSHSRKGDYFSPRLMANLHVLPDHTLRAGMTESSRMPTLFELAGDARYYPKNSLNTPLPIVLPARPSLADYAPYFSAMGQPIRLYASSGEVKPENLFSQEIGYFGNFREWRMTLDVRAYIERMRDIISKGKINIPGYLSGIVPAGTITTIGPLPASLPVNIPLDVIDFVNIPGFETRGLEYQLRWKPFETTEIWVNQSFARTFWELNADKPLPPTHATTIAWFQKLPYDLDLSVIHHTMGAMTWNKKSDELPSRRRIDVRLAKPFRIGSTRAEAAVTVQAANGSLPEYQTGSNLTFDRRAYGTLRFEF
ncbi:MAG: TonB-dependent receptor [Rhodocyclaceae bacterium]|nr:TonB-dependent receptor [Rhodocyclaceae bacterium]